MGGETAKAGRFIAPTMIEGMSEDSAIMQEEIFWASTAPSLLSLILMKRLPM